MASEPPRKTISIRQTRDGFVPDVEYIAYGKATLDEWGGLNMQNLGVGTPGDIFRLLMWLDKSFVGPTGTEHYVELLDTELPADVLEKCLLVGEDGYPVITVMEYNELRQAEKRATLRLIEEFREQKSKFWADLRQTILAPIAWIFPATESRTARGVYTELPSNGSQNNSSLAVASKSPVDLVRHIGVGGLNDASGSQLPRRRLVGDRVDKVDTDEL